MSNQNIWGFLCNVLQKGQEAVLVIVVNSSNESPGKTGFKMVVTNDNLFGTVGGGAVEYEMVNTARQMLRDKSAQNEIVRRSHNETVTEDSSGMICGGTQTMCLARFEQKHLHLFEELTDLVAQNGIAELCITRHETKIRFIHPSYCTSSFSYYMLKEKAGNLWEYYEIVRDSPDTAYIIGGGHVCQALAPLLKSLGFKIIVADEREEIAKQNEKTADEIIFRPFAEAVKLIKEGRNSYVFVMTNGHEHDESVLRGLVGKNWKYLGLVSSGKKWKQVSGNLLRDGFKKDDLARVHAPIGIPIHSHTATEVAISIAAEVIQVRNALPERNATEALLLHAENLSW